MKNLAVLAFLSLLAACSGTASVKQADQGVVRFHSEMNAGQYAHIYDASAEEMKATTKREDFIKFLTGAHAKLGAYRESKQVGWNDNYATGGHFVTLTYDSQFERGPAQEQFVYRMKDDQPILAGYHVNSNLFVTN